jgi:hypothetical protein
MQYLHENILIDWTKLSINFGAANNYPQIQEYKDAHNSGLTTCAQKYEIQNI